MRVADYIISYIYDRMKVNTIFMVSGGGIMHLTDAIACHGKIKYVCSNNEQATSMEADGFAKINGTFGVALVTSGPGATNAITGVVGAWQDSSSVVVISGQSKVKQTVSHADLSGLRQFGIQEVNIIPIVSSCTKYAVMIDDPMKIRYHLDKAVYLSRQGRPGPVWLDIPLDIQGAQVNPKQLIGFNPVREGYLECVNNNKLKQAVKRIISDLFKSKRPIIIAGQGVRIAGAVKQLNLLVKQLNVPVITPRMGIDLMDSNNNLFVGRPGIKGDRAGNFAVQNSDLVLSIGSRLSVPVVGYECDKFARKAKKIVVDVDEIEHKKTTIKIDTFVKADALLFIDTLAKYALKAKLKKDNDWPERCRKWKITYPVMLKKYKESKCINTYYFTDVLSKLLMSEDIVVIDSGSSSYVVSQGIKIKFGQRYIASSGLGAMGYAVPAAIGISTAINKKRVICITGDGSLHMNMQELSIIAHKKLPIKLFIFNNHGYSSIKTTQHNYFKKRFIGVDKNSGVYLSDTLSIAKLYGIKGIRLEKTNDIEKVCKETLVYNGPVLCDVICSPSQLIIPTVHSVKNNSGVMISKPLEDMYPFLDRKTFLSEMIVKPAD